MTKGQAAGGSGYEVCLFHVIFIGHISCGYKIFIFSALLQIKENLYLEQKICCIVYNLNLEAERFVFQIQFIIDCTF